MKLSVLIVCPYDIYRFGGVQEAVRAHARHLRGRGHEVTIIAPKSLVEHEPEPGIRTIGTARKIKALKTTSELSKSSRQEIETLLDQIKPDIVHFHEPWVPIMPSQLLKVAHERNIKTIATFHAMLPKGLVSGAVSKSMRPIVKPTIPRLDALVAVSDAAKLNIASMTDRDVLIIPNAIEEESYDPTKAKAHELTKIDKPVLLFFGRLEDRKGVEFLIRAVGDVEKRHRNKVRLIVCGDGPLKDSLDSLATELKLSDIHFLGFVDEAVKLSLLKGSDLFVSPALYGESFGIVLIEAMSMGVPVIGGDNPGYKSVLTGDGALGLIDSKDIKAFADRINSIIGDKNLSNKLSEWGLREIAKYTYTRVVTMYEEIYRELTS